MPTALPAKTILNGADNPTTAQMKTALGQLHDNLSEDQARTAGLVNGVLTAAAGTAAAPSLTTTGDTNTGLYFPAADTVAIATGGVKRVEVDASGNVGVGVTPSAWAVAWRGIDVGSYSAIANASGNTRIYHNAYTGGSSDTYKNTGAAAFYGMSGGAHQWYNAPSGTAGNPITFTQAMTLGASGNLLVGTTIDDGSSKLQLSRNGECRIMLQNTATPSTLQVGCDGTGGYAFVQQALPYSIYTNSAERARITSDGNLLVNATSNMAWTVGSSSANKLQLGGFRPIALNTEDGSINYKADTGGWAMGSYFYGSSGTYRGGFGVNGTADNLNYYWVGTAYNGTGALLTYGNTSWSALSDEREKTVHGNIENAVEKIKNIRAVYFNYNTDEPSVRRRAGFIAQDFQNVFPEIVQEIDRSDADATEEVKRLVMSYSETTPLLLAAIKEQQALIEAQKTAIESLTARITALEVK